MGLSAIPNLISNTIKIKQHFIFSARIKSIDDDIDAILKIQRNPQWQALSVTENFDEGSVDTQNVSSFNIEGSEKNE